MSELRMLDEVTWEVPPTARDDMRVPARVFADAELVDAIRDDGSPEQLCNVATLPGIVEAALAMPDVHQGYGFPVGGLAATAPPDGVVSPGGVGYDINCGVRLLPAPFAHGAPHDPPPGAPVGGPRWLVEHRDVGTADDVRHTESEGRLDGADPGQVSARARERGANQ